MLSRTAEGLFWMGRYVERMENVARLLDAGRRLDSLPHALGDERSEWVSIVIASGASTTFPHLLTEASTETVTEHLVRDSQNPSSISACIDAARMNAKAVRNALSGEVWEAINDTRSQLRARLQAGEDRENLADFLDWVRTRGGLILGKIENTLLRDDGLRFIELGKWFERADATARLLDVKYHVLLPKVTDVGGSLDTLQWVQILRAANSAVAFRHLYSRVVDPRGVVDLLVLNEKSPRSLLTAIAEINAAVGLLVSDVPAQDALLQRARGLESRLRSCTIDSIFSHGLHDWLTAFIVETNQLANDASIAFGFVPPQMMASQSQAQ